MKIIKLNRALLAASTVIIALPGTVAYANDGGLTPHHLVPPEPYAETANNLPPDEKLELREYLDYEQREPCQNYQPAPQPFTESHCDLHENRMPERAAPVVTQPAMVETMPKLRPVIADYTIYFDHDRHNIRSSEQPILDKVASEIKTYTPYEVTIAGYADRSGAADYNVQLSKKRADAVSRRLTAMGIPNRILDEEAYGESNPAVPTPDGVRLEENRRTVIQFRK